MTYPYPKVINHIGVSVTNIHKAISWYEEVLGFNVLRHEIVSAEDSSLIASNFKRIFGDNFKRVQVAWLSSGNSVGFELFEFEDPKAENNSYPNVTNGQQPCKFEYWKTGIFHICVSDPNIEDLCKKIRDNGGKQCTEVLHVNNSKPHYKIAYCQDPFGIIIEIFTYSYEQFNANTENVSTSNTPKLS
jgi:catechol 2,3-dioxygenase-like lactoylglutathione lyase family enzyme